MTSTIIPVLAAMYLGSSFDLKNYHKGNADIFDMKTLDKNIQVIDRSFTKSQYKLVDSSLQARKFLDVDGALSLKIKKGDVDIGGTGAYLKDTTDRQKFVELLVRVQHETVTETIPSYLEPKTDWMSMSPSQVGTHFVRSITYGGELIASLRLKASNRQEREIIKSAVTANLQLSGTFDLNANGSFDKLRKELKGMYNEEIKVMATKTPSSPPQTVEDLMKLVEEYPREIKTINNGKGKALKAELYPLSAFKKDYPLYLPNNAINNLLDDVETKYDDIRITGSEIRTWNNEREDTNDDDDEKVEELFAMIQKAQSAFHIAIAQMDVSSTGLASQFQKAFEAYGTGKDNFPNRFQRLFSKLRHEITKEPIIWEKPVGSGVVYYNWGSTTCESKSSTADIQLLYTGHASGTSANAWSGGKNFLCLPQETPKLATVLTEKDGLIQTVQHRSLKDVMKAEYLHCAACLAKDRIYENTFYGTTECPKDWKLEYVGYAMADSESNIDREFLCLSKEHKDHISSGDAPDGTPMLNPVFMTCQDCGGEILLNCVVCTK